MPRKAMPAYETEKSVFAQRLTEIMKERGENQTTLAAKLTSQYVTIQRQTISLYMNGQSKPDTERLTAIAKVLNVSTDWLLGLSRVRTLDGELKQVCQYTGLCQKAVEELHRASISDDKINIILSFVNTFLTSGVLKHFKEAAFYEAALKISHNKSKDVVFLSEINDDMADELRKIELYEEERKRRVIEDLNSEDETDGFIQVSTSEASILYQRIAEAAIESIYDDSIFEIEKKYSNRGITQEK